MDFKKTFAGSKQIINKRLIEIIDEKKIDYGKEFGINDEFFDIFINFLTSGKMLRGSLFIFSAESNGYKRDESLLNIACSLELMHSALLIHDDIMDNDEIRRGKKTIFAKYKELATIKNIKNPSHYGISMGIVIGDIALFIAEEIASYYNHSNLRELLQFYTQELRRVGIGQMLDFDYGSKNDEVELDKINKMYIYKSARYSFSLPLALGAIAAHKSNEEVNLIEKLGEKIGLIFQLVDDDIGMFGNEKDIGKSVGSDISENKKTIMRSLLMERVDNKTKKMLQGIFGNQKIDSSDIKEVCNLIEKLGVRKKIKEDMEELYKDSKEMIFKLDINDNYRKIYLQLLDYNLSRNY